MCNVGAGNILGRRACRSRCSRLLLVDDGFINSQHSKKILPRYENLYLTCSETSCVVPAASSHFPRNISPKNGFKGFFSEPNLSLLVLYDDFKVVKNHFKTSRARFAGSGSEAGATKIDGCSVQ